VKVLFSSFEEPHRVRTLGQEAGNAVAFGMSWAEAMKAVTANTADAFGLDAGRIAPGARADLVLWNGDPLEASSRPMGMWIGGRQTALGGRAGALLEKYRALGQ
jgi:imidazolonepropionase-like amidohydrolase